MKQQAPGAYVLLVLAMTTAAIVCMTGVMKFADLSHFEYSLRSWPVFQRLDLRVAASFAVPTAEVMIPGAFLAVPRTRRWAAMLLVGILLVFTALFMWQAWSTPISCACLGVLDRHARIRSDISSIVIRNLLLITPLALWLVFTTRHSLNTSRPGQSSGPTKTSRTHAFTLVELLVVIAIIGVIVSIVLIALARSRTHSRISASTSNVRQHALVFAAYAGDFRDSTPYFTRPLPGEQSEIPTPDGTVRTVFYFSAFFTWPYVLASGYYANDAGHPSFRSPLESLAPGQFAYLYPCQFLADPAFWRPETRTLPTAQFRNIRVSEVAFPAAKAFITDNTMWYAPLERDRASTVAGCVDGHAQRVWDSQMTRQYGTGDGAAPPYTPFTRHFASYNPLLHTVGGVHAPDFGPP